MRTMRSAGYTWRTAAAAIAAMACLATPVAAQGTNAGNMTFTGGFDVVNAYMFRGLLQDDTEIVMWPYGDLGIDLYDGTGGVSSVSINVGTWNSLHTGAAGASGPSGKLWYESDFYATLGIEFGPGLAFGTTYTAYTSPNNSFTTVKEMAFRLAMDDSGAPFGIALGPYALIAFEMDTSPGVGQADGGLNAGTYLELGAAPGWESELAQFSIPVRVGLSLDDYYELGGVDQRFGFFSIGIAALVPIAMPRGYGDWNVHGGLEFQALGETPEAFNGGDQSKVIALVGIGFSY